MSFIQPPVSFRTIYVTLSCFAVHSCHSSSPPFGPLLDTVLCRVVLFHVTVMSLSFFPRSRTLSLYVPHMHCLVCGSLLLAFTSSHSYLFILEHYCCFLQPSPSVMSCTSSLYNIARYDPYWLYYTYDNRDLTTQVPSFATDVRSTYTIRRQLHTHGLSDSVCREASVTEGPEFSRVSNHLWSCPTRKLLLNAFQTGELSRGAQRAASPTAAVRVSVGASPIQAFSRSKTASN